MARLQKNQAFNLSLPFLRREKKEKLERPIPIFRGHRSHKCHRTLNDFIQIVPRRLFLDETGSAFVVLKVSGPCCYKDGHNYLGRKGACDP